MKRENSVRANWKDSEVFRRFIELCLIEARPNNYSGSSLKKECWERIRSTLKAENKGDFTQRKLKNEWDYLKQKYIIWARLIGNTGNTHYDPVTTTINWTSKQWEEYLKDNPKASKFCFNPLEYPNEMRALFDGIVASGKNVWGPSKEGLPQDGLESCSQTCINLETEEIDMASSSTKKSKQEIKSEGKHPKKTNVEKLHDVDSQLMNVIEILEKSDGPSIKDCNEILDKMQGLTEMDPLYLAASSIFCESKAYREQWIQIAEKHEDFRLNWIAMNARKLGLF
ncbi:L10-interacting MYB domain-containing protein-like [Coffea arabica]|uniref:L10-interacting MYB domain-containing protein-like n=1 Tax=Coffea arabica TaxID=13443 RepID=A0A6P6X3J7_COFAR|nr:L10-interacting MYB domain-containing protein-like [Coffea arabica]